MQQGMPQGTIAVQMNNMQPQQQSMSGCPLCPCASVSQLLASFSPFLSAVVAVPVTTVAIIDNDRLVGLFCVLPLCPSFLVFFCLYVLSFHLASVCV
jgi:hypothetical protein